MHLLNLYISDCETNCNILKITDISQYDSSGDITNVTIKIIIPGLDCEYYPPFAIKAANYYSSNTFKITSQSCANGLAPLPDGVYDITYSVCPNETIFYNTKYLRVCATKQRVMGFLAPLLGCCEGCIRDVYGNDITDKRVDELKDLLFILEGAQQDAVNFKFNEAMSKLTYVNSILNSY